MTKIENIQIDLENKTCSLELVIPIAQPTTFEVLVDEYFNYKNIYNVKKQDHSYYFTGDEQITVTSVVDPYIDTNTMNRYKLTLHNIEFTTLDMKYFHVFCLLDNTSSTVQKAEGVWYDKTPLYYAEMDKLMFQCNVCADDATVDALVIVTFREQLLDKALAVQNYAEAMKMYYELSLILDLDLYNTKQGIIQNLDTTKTCSIYGGCS